MKRLRSRESSAASACIATGLLTLALAGTSVAAPPPDPNAPTTQPRFPRERPPRAFDLPGMLAIPAPPANGGQCVITVTATDYRHMEIQRWEVTGAPTASGANKLYPVRWSTSGSGITRSAMGSQVRDASWKVAAGADVQFLSQVIPNGNRLVHQTTAGVRIQNGLTGTQQLTVNGVPQTPGPMVAEAFEFGYPTLVAPAIQPQIIETKQFPNVTGVGFQAPGGASRMVDCSWRFVL